MGTWPRSRTLISYAMGWAVNTKSTVKLRRRLRMEKVVKENVLAQAKCWMKMLLYRSVGKRCESAGISWLYSFSLRENSARLLFFAVPRRYEMLWQPNRIVWHVGNIKWMASIKHNIARRFNLASLFLEGETQIKATKTKQSECRLRS